MDYKINKSSIKIPGILIIVCTCLSLICSCTTSKLEGYGVVKSTKKLGDINYTPKASTGVGLAAGAGTGAVAGGAVGLAGGLAAGTAAAIPTLGTSIIIFPLLGMTGGAIMGTIIGGAVGAGGGYVYGINEQGLGVFKIKLKDKSSKEIPIVYRQNLKSDINPGAVVKVYKDTKMGTLLGYHVVEASPEEANTIKAKIYSISEKSK